MRIYLSGPMRGQPRFGYAAFDYWSERLRDAGHEVVSPADLDRADGIDIDDPNLVFDVRKLLSRDIVALSDCHSMALIPGWAKSRGATAEYFFAVACGIAAYDVEDLCPEPTPKSPPVPKSPRWRCFLAGLLCQWFGFWRAVRRSTEPSTGDPAPSTR